jgi:hypothetical protein
MQNNMKNENSIFLYAVAGVLLFISSMAFVLAYKANVAAFDASYTLSAFVLFGSSISLITRAVKQDAYRVKQLD